ncbi:MAG: hypothetical protein ACYDCI_00120 [Candidatus Limnocylindrales bacterium]
MSTETTPGGAPPATPAAAAVPAPAPATTPAPAPAPSPPPTVTIPLEQLQTFTAVQARLAQLEAEQRSRDEAARAEQVRLMAAKGEVENAFKIQREEADKRLADERSQRNALEERAKRYALDGELSRVLASQALVAGGAEQLTTLWRNHFVVEPQGDSFTVRTPTFQTVNDFVATTLGRPEYAHFIRASHPAGGTAGTPSSGAASPPTTPANPTPTAQPKNFGEAIILQIQDKMSSQPADPRLNPAAAMGLNSRSYVRAGS